jgi:DNA repair photolyase
MKDFDVIEKYKSRIQFGLSITSTPERSNIMAVVEPNASCNSDRINLLHEAHKRGFRTYVMFCPLLPGIADSPAEIKELIGIATDCGVEEIFVEAVNPRGRGLKLTEEALKANGYSFEATHVDCIRYKEDWSWYVTGLIKNIQTSVRQFSDIRKLRFLLYANRLESQDITRIKQDDAGVIWLGKN